eukprot:TRINITY_DN2614_c0_g1_i2.p1 TRINITY_DN2614_c0_g1~~TRINITY_DN2614_c0_g1_i2.p1  ORF type:complete len:694 (-),score=137.63 TRINITY_DN2614_c0_g1_i2:185-2266(-)
MTSKKKQRDRDSSQKQGAKSNSQIKLPDASDDLKCSICFEYLECAVETNCAHCFCAECLMKHLEYKIDCPLCRQRITSLHRSLTLRKVLETFKSVNNLPKEDTETMKTKDQRLEELFRIRKAEEELKASNRGSNRRQRIVEEKVMKVTLGIIFVIMVLPLLGHLMTYNLNLKEMVFDYLNEKPRIPERKIFHSSAPKNPSQKHATKQRPKQQASLNQEQEFIQAAEFGNIKKMQELIEQGVNINKLFLISSLSAANQTNNAKSANISEKISVLHLISQTGNLESAALLTESGAEINVRTSTNQQTPLHLAVLYNRLDMVSFLLQRGADPNLPDIGGNTPLMTASQMGFIDIARILVASHSDLHSKSSNKWTAIHLAAENGHSSIVEMLLKAGAAIDDPGFAGQTPIYLASRAGDLKSVQLLYDKGAKIDKKSEELATPLYVAVEYGRLDVSRFLIEKGADYEVRMQSGASPIVIASQKGFREIVSLLLEYGANVDVAGAQKMNGLHLACLTGVHFDIVRLLLQNGINIDTTDQNGYSALHYAVAKKNPQAITLLLQYGADPAVLTGEFSQIIRDPYISHFFQDVKRIKIKIIPIDPTNELVATYIYMNTVSSYIELIIRIEKIFVKRVHRLFDQLSGSVIGMGISTDVQLSTPLESICESCKVKEWQGDTESSEPSLIFKVSLREKKKKKSRR